MFRTPPCRMERLIERIEAIMVGVTDDVHVIHDRVFAPGEEAYDEGEFFLAFKAAERLYEIKAPRREAEARQREEDGPSKFDKYWEDEGA